MSLGEDREAVRRFVKDLDIPFRLLLDEEGESPRLFGLWGHPNTVLIDRQGRVIGLVRGERDWQSEPARRLVRELLQGYANSAGRLPPEKILATPDSYEGQEVVVRGRVVKLTRAVFPNGRSYYALSVGDERVALTVFSWKRPAVREGDAVEVAGVFHVWRYNLRHMVDSSRITRLGSSN